MGSLGFWNFGNSRQDSLRGDCHPSVMPNFRERDAKHATRELPGRLQQLIGIDIDSDGDVFREWQFVERFPDQPAQTHDGFAADQNVETELAL